MIGSMKTIKAFTRANIPRSARVTALAASNHVALSSALPTTSTTQSSLAADGGGDGLIASRAPNLITESSISNIGSLLHMEDATTLADILLTPMAVSAAQDYITLHDIRIFEATLLLVHRILPGFRLHNTIDGAAGQSIDRVVFDRVIAYVKARHPPTILGFVNAHPDMCKSDDFAAMGTEHIRSIIEQYYTASADGKNSSAAARAISTAVATLMHDSHKREFCGDVWDVVMLNLYRIKEANRLNAWNPNSVMLAAFPAPPLAQADMTRILNLYMDHMEEVKNGNEIIIEVANNQFYLLPVIALLLGSTRATISCGVTSGAGAPTQNANTAMELVSNCIENPPVRYTVTAPGSPNTGGVARYARPEGNNPGIIGGAPVGGTGWFGQPLGLALAAPIQFPLISDEDLLGALRIIGSAVGGLQEVKHAYCFSIEMTSGIPANQTGHLDGFPYDCVAPMLHDTNIVRVKGSHLNSMAQQARQPQLTGELDGLLTRIVNYGYDPAIMATAINMLSVSSTLALQDFGIGPEIVNPNNAAIIPPAGMAALNADQRRGAHQVYMASNEVALEPSAFAEKTSIISYSLFGFTLGMADLLTSRGSTFVNASSRDPLTVYTSGTVWTGTSAYLVPPYFIKTDAIGVAGLVHPERYVINIPMLNIGGNTLVSCGASASVPGTQLDLPEMIGGAGMAGHGYALFNIEGALPADYCVTNSVPGNMGIGMNSSPVANATPYHFCRLTFDRLAANAITPAVVKLFSSNQVLSDVDVGRSCDLRMMVTGASYTTVSSFLQSVGHTVGFKYIVMAINGVHFNSVVSNGIGSFKRPRIA